MSPLKIAIFDEIRKFYKDDTAALSDLELNQLTFHHPDGLRLTLAGFVQLKRIFTVYSFEMPDNIKSKYQRNLAKLEFPYFFTQRRLILFSEMDATVVKLAGGVEQFLENIGDS